MRQEFRRRKGVGQGGKYCKERQHVDRKGEERMAKETTKSKLGWLGESYSEKVAWKLQSRVLLSYGLNLRLLLTPV